MPKVIFAMNNDLPRAQQISAFRRALVLAGGTVLLATSCNSTPDYGAQGNVFVPGQPRYGYGSPQSQQQADAAGRARPNPRTTDTTLYEKPEARKPVTIKRDPNNTTVDLSPPQSKPEKKDLTASGMDGKPADISPPSQEGAAPTETKPESKPEETKPAVTREDLPFGQPVVGKKGYVYSPYAPDKGQVDVVDIPSGTKVKCPYTNKTFRVP